MSSSTKRYTEQPFIPDKLKSMADKTIMMFDLSPDNKDVIERLKMGLAAGVIPKIYSSYADNSPKELAEFPEVKNLYVRAGLSTDILRYYIDNLPDTANDLQVFINIACGVVYERDNKSNTCTYMWEEARVKILFKGLDFDPLYYFSQHP